MRLKCLHPVILINPVSIHASVKDATRRLKNNCKSNLRFNPRICKRCDTVFKSLPDSKACFNPRICKRCDSSRFLLHFFTICFNPRICKRCDSDGSISVFCDEVSIHASVKDATYRLIVLSASSLFQSTHL